MCFEIEYAQSEAMKYPGGNERTQEGMLVLCIATLSLVFPGAARQKKCKTTISVTHRLHIHPIRAVMSGKVSTNISTFCKGRSGNSH